MRVSGEGRAGAERFEQVAGVRRVLDAPGDLGAEVEPQLHTFRRSPSDRLVREAVRAGRCPQTHAHDVERADDLAGIVGQMAEQPVGGDEEIVGRAHFRRRAAPGFGRVEQSQTESPQIAVGLAENLGQSVDERPGWRVGDEGAGELRGDETRRFGPSRDVEQRVLAAPQAVFGIGLAEKIDGARLVHGRIEDEGAGLAHLAGRSGKRPTGEDAREIGDIGLRVTGADAERVQLHDLSAEIFVEAALAVLAGLGVGSDRLRVVEVMQHRRVTLDRDKHVGELAEDVRADRLALEAAGGYPGDAALAR